MSFIEGIYAPPPSSGGLSPDSVAAQYLATSALGYPDGFINGTLVASVGSNALTIAIKTLAAADPSATDPTYIIFRNATSATGDYSVLTLTAAASLVVPSGALMGFANATPGRLWIVGFNDGGTFRLGAVNVLGATGIMALRDDLLLSSTTISASADNAQVIYSGTGVTTKPLRILGYMEWSAGLTTAGTWAIVPTKIQLFGPGISKPGDAVQEVADYSQTGSSTASTSYVDVTNSSLSITPTSQCNPIDVDYGFETSAVTSAKGVTQVLRGATVISGADAFQTAISSQAGHSFRYSDLPAAVVSTTYKVQQKGSAAGGTIVTSAISARLREIMA